MEPTDNPLKAGGEQAATNTGAKDGLADQLTTRARWVRATGGDTGANRSPHLDRSALSVELLQLD